MSFLPVLIPTFIAQTRLNSIIFNSFPRPENSQIFYFLFLFTFLSQSIISLRIGCSLLFPILETGKKRVTYDPQIADEILSFTLFPAIFSVIQTASCILHFFSHPYSIFFFTLLGYLLNSVQPNHKGDTGFSAFAFLISTFIAFVNWIFSWSFSGVSFSSIVDVPKLGILCTWVSILFTHYEIGDFSLYHRISPQNIIQARTGKIYFVLLICLWAFQCWFCLTLQSE